MFIPPDKLLKQTSQESVVGSKVRLKSSHLLIDREIVMEVFGESGNVSVVYYSDRRTLMLAPINDELFKKLHKTSQYMLKDRNLKGDKTVAIHDILIDNDVDTTNRDLHYDYPSGLGILNVTL